MDLRSKITLMALADITPYENNPRNNEEAVEKVANSIKEFGFNQPIVVDKDNVIIVGHTRYLAAQELGLTEAPVIVAGNLSDEQARAYRLADNKTGELAGWDFEKLALELEQIEDIDMGDFGFESHDLGGEIGDFFEDEIAKKFNKCFSCDNDDMVVLKGINCFSYCEHHIALMYNMTVDVGYIPNGKVIGISKIARIADAVTKRLQIQERIGKEIRDILTKILGTEDVIVVIQGEHSCMTARGIKKPGVKTKTASCGGQFLVNAELRKEFYLVDSK